jgi:hypothetical protein
MGRQKGRALIMLTQEQRDELDLLTRKQYKNSILCKTGECNFETG